MSEKNKYLHELKTQLREHAVETEAHGKSVRFWTGDEQLEFFITGEGFDFKTPGSAETLPFDYLVTRLPKVKAMILSRLKLNTSLFARNCEVMKISKIAAQEFLDNYHLMNSAQSAFNYGLFHKGLLVAVASFSKGRKMRRLHENTRSYELIRFCCKPGYSIAGGLSKLVKTFCREKKAGDVMTYVDKQLSDGTSFQKAGFKKQGETAPVFFLIDKTTYERRPLKPEAGEIERDKYYITSNAGSIKLIYTPNE